MRSSLSVVAGVGATALLLAGCGGSTTSTSSTSASAAGSAASSAPATTVMVGMAYDVGGRGDQSFNDAAAAGMDKAKAEFGVKTNESTATAGEAESAREGRLTTLIDNKYNALVAVGFAYAPAVKKVAGDADNKDIKFALIDSVDATGANVQNVIFAEEQGSYLAGVAAALKSKSGNIGFIGGVQTDLIKKFEAGYVAGAKATNPSIKVQTKYLTQAPDFSGFGDPAKGKTAAEGMLSAGADVIYHAAGGSGGGVFTAVKAKAGTWAIGVDSDQAKTAASNVRDVILTSMVKKVDVGVYEFIKQVKDGTFKAGPAKYDLASGGVELSATGGHIDDIKAKLDAAKADIISGKIVVPTK